MFDQVQISFWLPRGKAYLNVIPTQDQPTDSCQHKLIFFVVQF